MSEIIFEVKLAASKPELSTLLKYMRDNIHTHPEVIHNTEKYVWLLSGRAKCALKFSKEFMHGGPRNFDSIFGIDIMLDSQYMGDPDIIVIKLVKKENYIGYFAESIRRGFDDGIGDINPANEEYINLLPQTHVEYLREEAKMDIRKQIKQVIFNDPATIILWKDGSKTVVKCENEKYDPEKGLAMAISKKVLGDKGNYYDVFKKWLPEEDTRSKDSKECIWCRHAKLEPDAEPCIKCHDHCNFEQPTPISQESIEEVKQYERSCPNCKFYSANTISTYCIHCLDFSNFKRK